MQGFSIFLIEFTDILALIVFNPNFKATLSIANSETPSVVGKHCPEIYSIDIFFPKCLHIIAKHTTPHCMESYCIMTEKLLLITDWNINDKYNVNLFVDFVIFLESGSIGVFIFYFFTNRLCFPRIKIELNTKHTHRFVVSDTTYRVFLNNRVVICFSNVGSIFANK